MNNKMATDVLDGSFSIAGGGTSGLVD